ncbi:MAG: hypothetical protein AAF919_08065 [Pseudomonadota bacterium]
MTTLANQIADELAKEVIAHVEKTGDEDLISILGKVLGDSSSTLQEAFITSVRVQRAAIRARKIMQVRLKEFEDRGFDV